MKTGPSSNPLSARLAENMSRQRADQADLLQSQMRSLQRDLQTISQDALDTMKADITAFREASHSMIWDSYREIESSINWIRRFAWMGPVRAALIVMTGLILITAMAWALSLASTRISNPLSSWGLTAVPGATGPHLLIDLSKVEIGSCALSGTSQPCLRRKE